MAKIIHVGGAKGVGKTTLLKELHGAITAKGHEIHVVHMSDFLKKMGHEIFGNEWGTLDEIQRSTLRSVAAGFIKEIRAHVVLLDSHVVDMKNGKPNVIMPKEFEEIIDGYMVVTAGVKTVHKRRSKDQEFRDRDLSLSNIRKEIEAELSGAHELAFRKGQDVRVVTNRFFNLAKGDILESVDYFMEGFGFPIEGDLRNYGDSFSNIERI